MYCRGVPKLDARMLKKEKQPIILLAAWHFTKGYMVRGRKRKEIIYINDVVPFCCFDASVCAPTNKLCPNDGTPVGCENKLGPGLKLAGLKGGSVPAADPMPGVMADARNGFAAPRPTPKPVACGRSPTPIVEPILAVGELVGCAERPELPPGPTVPTPVVGDDTPPRPVPKPAALLIPFLKPVVDEVTPPRPAPRPTPPDALTPLVPVVQAGGDTAAEAASSAGVVDSDCGIGGSASRSDAPKDEDGLNALTPALKPVACGRNGAPVGWLDSAVLPVGCTPNELRSESEKVDPVAVVVGVEALVLDEPKEVNDEVVG